VASEMTGEGSDTWISFIKKEGGGRRNERGNFQNRCIRHQTKRELIQNVHGGEVGDVGEKRSKFCGKVTARGEVDPKQKTQVCQRRKDRAADIGEERGNYIQKMFGLVWEKKGAIDCRQGKTLKKKPNSGAGRNWSRRKGNLGEKRGEFLNEKIKC